MNHRALSSLIITIFIMVAGYLIAAFFMCDTAKSNDFFCPEIKGLPEYYEKHIRGHLFAGFLALGGFLLSLKTFIVVNMKENLYDSQEYKENWEKQSKLHSGKELKLYTPLKELSDLLFYAILAAILSAILQMTLGLYSHWSTTLVCLGSAIYATTLLIESLRVIKRNLDTWFSYLES